jgi:hypothetical protein
MSSHKQKVADYAAAQREKQHSQAEREALKKEIK